MRIACVQNGNFTLARHVLAAGGPETYNGQRYTVDLGYAPLPKEVVALEMQALSRLRV